MDGTHMSHGEDGKCAQNISRGENTCGRNA